MDENIDINAGHRLYKDWLHHAAMPMGMKEQIVREIKKEAAEDIMQMLTETIECNSCEDYKECLIFSETISDIETKFKIKKG